MTTLTEREPLLLNGRTLRAVGHLPAAGRGALAVVGTQLFGALDRGTVWIFDGAHVRRAHLPLDMTDAAALGKGTLVVGRSLDATPQRAGHAVAAGVGLGPKSIFIDLGSGEPVMLAVLAKNAYVVSGLCDGGYRVTRISPDGAVVASRKIHMIRAGALVNGTIVMSSQRCDGGAPALLETLDPVTLETHPLPATGIDTPARLADATAFR